MAILDPVADFVELTVLQGYDETATQIDIVETDVHFDLLPDPTVDGAYNLLWYDDTNYGGRPQDDPNREWVRVTNWNESAHRLIVTRGQQGTAASTKNTSGAAYKMIMAIGKKWRDDIEAAGIDVGTKYAWITEYGGVGDGSTDDWQAFDDAKDAGITYLVVPEGTWRFSTDFIFPDTMTLDLKRNAVLAPDAGQQVAIDGPIIAGNWQIFGGSGTCVLTSRAGIQYDRWDNTANSTVIIGTDEHNYTSLKVKSWYGPTLTVDTQNIGECISVHNSCDPAYAGQGITIENDGSGYGLMVQQDGDGTALYVNKTSPAGTLPVMEIDSAGPAIALQVDQDGAADAVVINQVADDQALQINKTDAGSAYAVQIHNDGSGIALSIKADSTGKGLDIDKAAYAGNCIDVTNLGTGNGLIVTQTGNADGVSIVQDGTGVPLNITGTNGNCIIIGTAKTPASQTATGVVGTICWDASYLYVCTATNYWERVAIAAW